MGRLGIGVVNRVMTSTLKQADVVQKRDESTIFLPAPMSPFMDLVGIAHEDGKKHEWP
jgi:hypothetical protein